MDECKFDDVDDACLTHSSDSVVFCGSSAQPAFTGMLHAGCTYHPCSGCATVFDQEKKLQQHQQGCPEPPKLSKKRQPGWAMKQARATVLKRFAAQCGDLPFTLDCRACKKPCIDGFKSGKAEELLEHFEATPLCGGSPRAANDRVKAMGFGGVCGFAGCAKDSCGAVPPHVASLACSGSESGVLQCPMSTGESVFCAPEESVVLTCAGPGDPIGKPAA